MSPIKNLGGPDRDRGTAAEYLSPGRFAGKVALITGAGSGIGRATARRLAAEGASVACLDVVEEAVGVVAAEINEDDREGAGSAIALRCDVTDEEMVAAAVARAADELGVITNLCNIAGIGGFSHTTEQSLAGWNKILSV